jgi:ABC-2 type transport system permease protein
MVISIAGLAVTFVPLYFISRALQPVVEESIRAQGGDYFGFLIVGMAVTFLFTAAVSALPRALAGAITSGTLEALLVTRTPLALILAGMAGYTLLWNGLRVLLLLGGALVLGVQIFWTGIPLALAAVVLMLIAYYAIGLIAGSLVLVFRTAGPLVTGVLAASGLLGGVYYNTTAIPSGLQELSVLVPVTYALRAIRQLVLGGASAGAVVSDIVVLAGFAAVLLAIAAAAFRAALRHARAAGTLSQY